MQQVGARPLNNVHVFILYVNAAVEIESTVMFFYSDIFKVSVFSLILLLIYIFYE